MLLVFFQLFFRYSKKRLPSWFVTLILKCRHSSWFADSSWKDASLLNVALAVCSEMAWVMFFSTNEEVANAITLNEDFISVAEIFCSDQIANLCVQNSFPRVWLTPKMWFQLHHCLPPPQPREWRRGRGGSLFKWKDWRTGACFCTLAFSTVLGTELVLTKLSLNKRLGFTSGTCKTSSHCAASTFFRS